MAVCWSRALLCLLVLLAPCIALADPVIAVIVSPSHADARFSEAELALVYQRKHQFWPDGHHIEPINLPADDPLRRTFSLAVLKLPPSALDNYWNEQYFRGVRPPYVVRSPEAARRFVALTPTAIAYVDACALDDSVAVVGILADGHWEATHTPPSCPAVAAPDGD